MNFTSVHEDWVMLLNDHLRCWTVFENGLNVLSGRKTRGRHFGPSKTKE